MPLTKEQLKETDGFKTAAGYVDQAVVASRTAPEAVTDEATLEAASSVLVVANAAVKHVEERRKIDKKPSLDEGRVVDSTYKELASPLEAVVERTKKMVGDYQTEQALARIAAEEAAAAEAQEAPIEPARQEPVRPAAGGSVSSDLVWKFEVVEPSKLPADLRKSVPDEDKIRARVDGGAREIPGVRVYPDSRQTVRRS